MASVNVQFRLVSILKQFGREKGIGDTFTLQLAAGATLAQAMEQVGVPARRIGRFLRNGQTLLPDYAPADGEVIDVLPPTISGG